MQCKNKAICQTWSYPLTTTINYVLKYFTSAYHHFINSSIEHLDLLNLANFRLKNIVGYSPKNTKSNYSKLSRISDQQKINLESQAPFYINCVKSVTKYCARSLTDSRTTLPP